MDEPDSEDVPDEARSTSESILEQVEEAETEAVDTSEARIYEEEILQDTTIEPEDIAPVDQPPAEPTPAEEEAPIVTEPKQDAVALETEQVSPQPVSVPAPITSTRTEPPPPQSQAQAQTQTKWGRLSRTVVGWSAVGAAVAVIVGLLASGVIPIVGGSDPTATPQMASTAAPAATTERAAATVPPAGPTIPAEARVPTDGPFPTEPPAFDPEPRLSVVIAPPTRESNLPWELSTQNLLPLRPALESLVDVGRFTGEYIPMLAHGWEVTDNGTSWTFFLRRGVEFYNGLGEVFAGDVLY
ncbi:MAG TPA: hypothetical protein EYM38_01625, partial [Dehalococcoidia bacterium]|nr:hypothetical protein [Dehalococcoidia bacterium]